ncbi:MAG TPA: VOC family protein [Candidatus Limnocylindrales bacterium]|nr:VOC family protein [Candidatus Limnocylindrales bacterium]
MNPFSHIDLRVKSLERALPFYSVVLPALGFKRTFHSGEWNVFAGDGDLPSAPYFAITEDPEHHPNKNRIAFWLPSREEVDRLSILIRGAGGNITGGPKLFPEISSSYYALYFEDPSGNRLELVHRID